MEAKYIHALKAGLIGGVIFAACILLNFIIEVITSRSIALGSLGLVTCCVWIIMVIVLVGTGALAAFMAKGTIAKLEEALLVGVVAGAIAGLIATIMEVVVAIVRPWLVNSYVTNYYSSAYPELSQYSQYGLGSNLGQTAGGVVASLCCCGPAFIVIGAILAAIGAAIYASLKLKLS